MTLPAQYQWLSKERGPKMLLAALGDYGVTEKQGTGNNPVILGWAKDLGIDDYTSDSIPWCGLSVAHWAKESGWADQIPRDPLWARNWETFGTQAANPGLGDVLVFVRPGGGHVGLYVGEDGVFFHVLGGNQDDAVAIVQIKKSRLIAARHPRWRFLAPASRRKIVLSPTGTISKNEA